MSAALNIRGTFMQEDDTSIRYAGKSRKVQVTPALQFRYG